ncbi:ER degradation-enhancing alpha-mannosidase-like protein 1 [Podochytrium sp. JEL0797]|nr:ER degradation-enhancing alpha-mannosidase-like protein 1 [Podochytrium sp. JEL0797]
MIVRFATVAILALLGTTSTMAMPTAQRLDLKERAREMFRHGFNGYMEHAFPLDELNPLTCSGRTADRTDPTNWNINDVLGNFSVTLVDSLDAIYTVLGPKEFHSAVTKVIDHVSFDQDSRVQVFEVTIRMLGGLVSAHYLAEFGIHQLVGSSDGARVSRKDRIEFARMEGYRGELLALAEDLGERLLPAFETSTGMPFPRINLRKGVLKTEVRDTCTAGAGTLLMEFGSLARLLSTPSAQQFETKAKKSLEYLWSRRSHLDLLGNTIAVDSGVWLQKLSGVGAGADSFYEYLLKSYVLFGDSEFYDMFDQAYKAILVFNKDEFGYFYKNVDMDTGSQMTNWVDSLSAFFPGLQVLHGDLEHAIKAHFVHFTIWQKFRAFPERFDFAMRMAGIGHYPLRPELIESTYFLYLSMLVMESDVMYVDSDDFFGKGVVFCLLWMAYYICWFLGRCLFQLVRWMGGVRVFREHEEEEGRREREVAMDLGTRITAPAGSPDASLVPKVTLYPEGYRINTLHNVKLTVRLDSSASNYQITKFTLVGTSETFPLQPPFTTLKVSSTGISFLIQNIPQTPPSTNPSKPTRHKTETLLLLTKSIPALSTTNTYLEFPILSSKFSRPLTPLHTTLAPLVSPHDSTTLSPGCNPYTPSETTHVQTRMAIITRGGGCTFQDKAHYAHAAGAVAVGIVNTDNAFIGMLPNADATGEDVMDIPVVMIRSGDWMHILREVVYARGAGGEVGVRLVEREEEGGEVEEEVGVVLQYGNRPIKNLVIVRKRGA